MPTIIQNHYVLAVHDVKKSAAFYVDILGFKVAAEPQGWIFVRKDNCMLMLGECPDDMHPSQLGCHNYFGYLKVDDVDGYFAQVMQAGGDILFPPTDKPWGMREFGVKSADGHRIMIGQEIKTAGAAQEG
jgi:predicted enzyme related to lactoylglutathione lyase